MNKYTIVLLVALISGCVKSVDEYQVPSQDDCKADILLSMRHIAGCRPNNDSLSGALKSQSKPKELDGNNGNWNQQREPIVEYIEICKQLGIADNTKEMTDCIYRSMQNKLRSLPSKDNLDCIKNNELLVKCE